MDITPSERLWEYRCCWHGSRKALDGPSTTAGRSGQASNVKERRRPRGARLLAGRRREVRSCK